MRNDGLILNVLTMDGKIVIKTSPEGRPTKGLKKYTYESKALKVRFRIE